MTSLPYKTIVLNLFGYAGIFEGCPIEVTSRIAALSRECGVEIAARAWDFRRQDRRAFNAEVFDEVSRCLCHDFPRVKGAVQLWLEELPFQEREPIFLIYPQEWVLMTTWDNFRRHAHYFWEPFAAVDVCDESFSTGLVLGPEEIGYYVERKS